MTNQTDLEGLPVSGGRRPFLPAWIVWLALAVAIVAAGFLVPWKEAWTAVIHARKIWLAAALGICLTGTPILAAQWRLFLPPQYHLPWTRMFEITVLTVMARATLPFMTGDASSVGLMVMRGGLSPGAAVSVLTLDQLFVGLEKVAMVCATLAFASLPPPLKAAGASLVALVACFLAAMLAAAIYGRSLHGVAAKLPPRAGRIIGMIAGLTAHLEFLRRPWKVAGALMLTVAKKAIEVGATLAVQHAVGIDLPLWNTIVVVTALNLASVIPGPPAGLGVFEATSLFIYHYLGVPPGTAFAAAVLLHAIYLTTDFTYGYAVLITETARRRLRASAHPAGQAIMDATNSPRGKPPLPR